MSAALKQAPDRAPRSMENRAAWWPGVSAIALLGAIVSPAQAAPSSPDGTVVTAPSLTGDGFAIAQADRATADADAAQIRVRADGHSVDPVMSAGLIDSERTVVAGSTAYFATYLNYPSYATRGEIRIFRAGQTPDAEPIAIALVDRGGFASWQPQPGAPSDLFYVFRAYDNEARFDETRPEELIVLEQPVKIEAAPVSRPGFGSIDEARIRGIPLSKAATVTVEGSADAALDLVRVGGQLVLVDEHGRFAAQQLVARDSREIRVDIESDSGPSLSTVRDIRVPRSDWFFVGQGDLTFVSSHGKGPAVEVGGDKLADGDHVTSRAAFYTKGRFGDDWRLTASLDTGETLLRDIFSNLDRKDPRQLLRRLDSNEYYTTYGDDSTLVEDAPTQGAFYLRLQRADSTLLVGNFTADIRQAELAQLNRGLFGAILDHKSLAATSFGERKLQLTAFASDPGTVPGRDELRGTGGSLYFLKRQDLSVGSERLSIETRDRDTGLVFATIELRPQEDYEIDYLQGRVTLRKPLASTVADRGVVREGSSTGNVPVLVAHYEYSPAVGSLDGYTLGGRGSAWLGETLRLGVTAQRETTAGADQTLLGADGLLRFAAGTFVKAEIAQTDGPGFGQTGSVDGGLSFSDVAAPGLRGSEARAWRVEGAADLAEITGRRDVTGKLGAFYEHFDAGFSANAHLTLADTTRWGASGDVALTATTQVAGSYEELRSASAGLHRVATADLAQKLGGGITGKLGLRHDRLAPGLLYNSAASGARTDAALELEYKRPGADWSVHGFGQVTLEHDASRRGNDRAGAGAKAELTDRLSLNAEVSGGEGGLGADVQLNHRYGEGSQAYLGYALLADRTASGTAPLDVFTRSNQGTLTVGARHRYNSALSLHGENRIGIGGPAPSATRSFGLKFDPTQRLSFSGLFEKGRIDDASTGEFRRTAATVGVGYTTKGVQLGSSVEARFERGAGREQQVWLVRNTAAFQANADWRVLGRFNFAIADDDGTSLRAADFVEGVLGFAYRPVRNDPLNLLARYQYFQDLGPVGQVTAGGEINSPKQRSQIGSIDVNYDLTQSFTIGGKYAMREGKVSLDRTSDSFVSSTTQLGVIRVDWRPVKRWDALVEARYLTNDAAGNDRWGVLAALYRHVGNNVKIGVGYDFADFSDDLADQSYTSKGFFVNLLSKF